MPELQTDIQVIEKLESDVLGTTQELQNLQGSINGLNAEEKAQVISENSQMLLDIQQTIKACREECNRLEQENKAENAARLNQLKANLAKLEQIYTQVNQQVFSQTNADLNQLSNDTIASQNQSEQNQDNPDQKEPEKKGIRGWWKGLTDGQRRGIRIGGGVLAGVGIISLFRRRRKSESSVETSGKSRREIRRERRAARREARRSKPFWDRPIGKVVKWTAIGGGVYYVVHGLITGKWSPKDVGDWGNNRLDDSVSQVSAYEKLSEEQREQYEKLGDGVNDMYGKIWEKEVSLGFEDQNELGTISNRVKFKEGKTAANYSGLVPFCMDKDADNVKEILGEQDLNEYFFNKNISELKNKIKGWTTEKLEKLLGPFVDKLQSFQVFGSQPGASLGEKIKKWLDYDSEERDAELDFFFRQYSKVLVYLKDRETILKYKIAEGKLKNTGYDGKKLPEDEDDKIKFIQEVLEDDEWVKANIENNNVYKNFMESKLISVSRIMESQNISNTDMSGDLESRLDDLDDTADDLLQIDENNNTIVDKGLSEIGGGLSDKTGKNLMKMCDDVQDDMADETGTGFIQEYFEWLSYACNTEEDNKQEFLEASGLGDVVKGMADIMNGYKNKIKNKTITAEELKDLKKITLEYTAMKKEIEVAMYTMKSIKSDDPNAFVRIANTCFKFVKGFVNSVSKIIKGEGKFGDWLNVGVSIVIAYGVIYIVKNPLKAGKQVVRLSVGAVSTGLHAVGWAGGKTLLTSRWLGGEIERLASKGVPLLEQKRFFLNYILNGKAREEGKLIRIASTKFSIEAESGADLIHKMCPKPKLDSLDQAEMVWKYSGNKNLKKLFMESGTDWAHVRKRDILFHNKATKSFDFNKNVLNNLKEIDVTIEGMDKAAGKGMDKLLKGVKEVEDLETLKVLAKNDNFVNQLKTLNRAELKQFRKHLKEFRGDKLNKILTGELKISDAVAPFMRNSGRQATRLAENTANVVSDVARPVNNVVNTTTDAASEAMNTQRKALEEHLDDSINRLKNTVKNAGKNERGISRVPLKENALKRLESLKATTQFTEEEAESFMKLINKGFNVEYIDQLDAIFKLECKFGKEGKIMGPELKKLLLAGKYDDFKNILVNASDANKKIIKEAGIEIFKRDGDDVLKSLGKVFKIEKGVGKVADDVIKAFCKIVSKIF